MPTVLLDENLDGYAEYLLRFLLSPTWRELTETLEIRVVVFDDFGLEKGISDEVLWEFCQSRQIYLLTDNRNQQKADSLESMIQTRNQPSFVPIFTISDIPRFRSDRDYAEAVVVTMLEYLMDAENLRGTGRLYLP